MNIDIGHSVTYAFEDNEWKAKVGVLLLLGLIPGMNVIVWGGYALSIAHNILRDETPLPNWDDWSDIAVRGFLSIIATVMYLLPAIIVLAVFTGVAPVVSAIGGRTIPAVFGTVRLVASVLALVYSLIALMVLNVGHVRYADSDQFFVYRDLGHRLYDLRTNLSLFLQLFLFELVLGIVAGGVATLLSFTCLGYIAIMTLGFLANGYILGVAGIAFDERLRASGRTL